MILHFAPVIPLCHSLREEDHQTFQWIDFRRPRYRETHHIVAGLTRILTVLLAGRFPPLVENSGHSSAPPDDAHARMRLLGACRVPSRSDGPSHTRGEHLLHKRFNASTRELGSQTRGASIPYSGLWFIHFFPPDLLLFTKRSGVPCSPVHEV